MSEVTKIVRVTWREYRKNEDGPYDFDDCQRFVCGEDVTTAIDKAIEVVSERPDDEDTLERFVLLGVECLAEATDWRKADEK